MKLKDALKEIRPVDEEFLERAQQRLDNLTKPPGSLGRLEEMAKRLVGIYRDEMPDIPRKVVFTFAGDHGVTEEGVSAYPKEVTRQMVFNFLGGGAGINVLARHAGAEVVVIDIGVDHDFGELQGLKVKKVTKGTKNFTRGPAMSRDEAVRSVEVGIELAREYYEKGYRMFGTGEMGIGNTTPSSAIISVLGRIPVEDVTGRGTGISDESLKRKIGVIKRAIEINRPDPEDPLDVLSKVGGTEIGGIAGLCIGGAALGVPVVVDGFISTAGAVIAVALNRSVRDYLIPSHLSQESGHGAMLEYLGMRPLLDFDLRLGEGTGAALAMTVLDASLKIYREMATFGDAGVSDEVIN